MDYLSIANSGLMFFLCGAVIVFVTLQSIFFAVRCWRRGVQLGMSKGVMKTTVANAAVFCIIPSIPIVIFLLAMMPVLGTYFPWLRLSVIGSYAYENMAAEATAQGYGLNSYTSGGFTAEMFGSAMWVMTISITYGLFAIVIGLKKFQGVIKKASIGGESGKSFGPHLIGALFLGMMASFVGPYLAAPLQPITWPMVTGLSAADLGLSVSTGMIPFLVTLVSSLMMVILIKLGEKLKSRVLTDFSMPICLLVAMGFAMFISPILSA